MSLSPPRMRNNNTTYQPYWCYQCHRTVRISPSTNPSNIVCPRCYGQFVSEIDIQMPRLIIDYTDFDPSPEAHLLELALSLMPDPPIRRFNRGIYDPLEPEIPQGRSRFHSRHHPNPPQQTTDDTWTRSETEARPRRRRRNRSFDGSENLDTETGVHNRPRTRVIHRPADPSIPFAPLLRPEDLIAAGFIPREYFFRNELYDLIDELTQNDRPGPPPLPEPVINTIPTVKIRETHLRDNSNCPVCMEEFKVGGEAKELPCNHIFHSDCIVPWLRLHNSCPVCRHELPMPCEQNDRDQHCEPEVSSGISPGEQRDSFWLRLRLRLRQLASLWPFRSRNRQISPQLGENDASSATSRPR